MITGGKKTDEPKHGEYNPYAPPSANPAHQLVGGTGNAEARRMELAPVESLAKAIGWYNLLLGIWPLTSLIDNARFVILHPLDRIPALWILRVVINAATLLLCLAALCFFLKQKRISLLLEFAMVLGWTAAFFFHRIFATPRDTLGYLIWEALLYALLVLPVAELIRLRNSPVFSPQYAVLVADTRHIKVKAKLPRRITIGMIMMLVVLVVVAGFVH